MDFAGDLKLVRLNIGGSLFCTERETLLIRQSSGAPTFFDGLLNCSPQLRRTEDGALWIDRDGGLFEHILRWMREHRFKRRAPLPKRDLDLLRAEADFYLLTDLVAEIDTEMENRKAQLRGGLIATVATLGIVTALAVYFSRKNESSSAPPPASPVGLVSVGEGDLAMCLLDELSAMKSSSLS